MTCEIDLLLAFRYLGGLTGQKKTGMKRMCGIRHDIYI